MIKPFRVKRFPIGSGQYTSRRPSKPSALNPFTRWFLLAVAIIVFSLIAEVTREGLHTFALMERLGDLSELASPKPHIVPPTQFIRGTAIQLVASFLR